MKRRLIIGAVLLVACSEPTAPGRTAWYSFDFAGDVFRWPESRVPVRYYADPRSNMRDLVERAIGAWENQVLYGEFSGEMVNDSTAADVIVTWFDSRTCPPPRITARPCSHATASRRYSWTVRARRSRNRFTRKSASRRRRSTPPRRLLPVYGA